MDIDTSIPLASLQALLQSHEDSEIVVFRLGGLDGEEAPMDPAGNENESERTFRRDDVGVAEDNPLLPSFGSDFDDRETLSGSVDGIGFPAIPFHPKPLGDEQLSCVDHAPIMRRIHYASFRHSAILDQQTIVDPELRNRIRSLILNASTYGYCAFYTAYSHGFYAPDWGLRIGSGNNSIEFTIALRTSVFARRLDCYEMRMFELDDEKRLTVNVRGAEKFLAIFDHCFCQPGPWRDAYVAPREAP